MPSGPIFQIVSRWPMHSLHLKLEMVSSYLTHSITFRTKDIYMMIEAILNNPGLVIFIGWIITYQHSIDAFQESGSGTSAGLGNF